jgi:type I restriction enzyme S subunit
MDKYPEYKNTGIDWLGPIPSQWSLKRIGQLFSERKQKVDDKTFPPLSVTMSGVVDQLSDIAKTDHTDNRKLVRKGDFVINSRSDRKGSSGISPRDGSVSVINIVMEPREFEPSFHEYLFKSFYFKEEFFRNGKGIHWDLWSTKWDQLKVILIPVPSPNTQSLISTYLDRRTFQIDSLIEKIQQKIELLKEQRTSLINQCVTKGLNPNVEMKDSEVKWIGETPSHWKVKRLKYFSSVELSSVDRHIVEDEVPVDVCHYTQVYKNEKINKTTKLSKGTCTPQELKKFSLFKGDIILTKDSESPDDIGIPTFIEERLQDTVCGYHLCHIRVLKKEINPEFVYRFIESTMTQRYFSISSNGVTRFGLGKPIIENMSILLPPPVDQQAIVDQINRTSTSVLSTISKETKRIQLLKEYRQSLISNVVTGKMRITEEMI